MNEREYEHILEALRQINHSIEHGFDKIADRIERLHE